VSPDRSTPVAPAENEQSAAGEAERAADRLGLGRHGRRVDVVEDDASVCESLVVLLETYGFDAVAYASGAALLADQRRHEMGCLIIDHHMAGMDGLEVLTVLRREAIVVPTILVSGRFDAAIAECAGKLGVTATLEKPLAIARLIELLVSGGTREPR
jgi:two-component system, LuxR family, response regulator FixJ